MSSTLPENADHADRSDAPDIAGDVIAGRWELLRPLGRGSFGRTYLARDRSEGGEVAVKVLDPVGADTWKARELFEREAAVLRSLRHPGVPEVHDLVTGEWRGTAAAFLVMEYVEGVSLERMIEERRTLSGPETVALLVELLDLLDYLHGRVPPVLHRDIKPSNVIVRPGGRPALVDFGSVRETYLGPDESGSTVAGTYGYMPYEQYMGQATPASDLYALAATFLHLLTGRPPRDFMNEEGRIEVPDPLPGDPRLRPVLARMLLTSPTERPSSARDVRDALLAVGAPAPSLVPVRAAPGGVLPPAPRRLEGETAELLDRLAPSMWELMDESKAREGWGAFDWLSAMFFSLLSAGILPIVFAGMARKRRRRLKRFLVSGSPALARILEIRLEETQFDAKLARVAYEFEADGELQRGVDEVLPFVAGRWREGDVVRILYLPEDKDSVIVSTR